VRERICVAIKTAETYSRASEPNSALNRENDGGDLRAGWGRGRKGRLGLHVQDNGWTPEQLTKTLVRFSIVWYS
jgi:hypothetical protein